MAAHPSLEAIRHGVRELADPEKAAPMRAYMKSEMPPPGARALLDTRQSSGSTSTWS